MLQETLAAIVLSITAVLASIGTCLQQMHLKKCKMESCCGSMSVDLTATQDVEIKGQAPL